METTTERLQLGVVVPTWAIADEGQSWWEETKALARLVEETNIDTLWVPDHLLRDSSGGAIVGFWECWTVLSALAAVTSRLTVGPFVACTGFHNPAHLAKMAETLDEVSGGRTIIALGAGVPDHDRSWQAFGFPDDHPAGRFEEALEIITRLLKGERLTYSGQFFHTENCETGPHGSRGGRIPVWAAGKGPRTMRAAAKWADALNLNVVCYSAEDVKTHLAKLDEACHDMERDPASVLRTGYTIITFAGPDSAPSSLRERAVKGTPEEIARTLHEMHLAGMQHLTCFLDDGEGVHVMAYPALTPRAVEQFAPVVEALRKLES